MKSVNKVAQILKVYSAINLAVCIILAIYLDKNINIEGVGICFFAISQVISFAIFAFGEVIQLLHDIKINTGNKNVSYTAKTDELPEL